MTDIRSRLADALAEFFDRNNITVGTSHPSLAVEALLSLPGIAIVETGQDSVAEAIYEAHRVAYGDVCWSRWAALGEIGRDTYRRMAAAALLASADRQALTDLADQLELRQREHAISASSNAYSRGAESAYRAAQLSIRQILAAAVQAQEEQP